MASIRAQGNKFYVYYYNPLIRRPDGRAKQQSEGFYDLDKANTRKEEIEKQIKSGYFKISGRMTVQDYFKTVYIPLYCSQKWAGKTWDSNMQYWENHILPYFGSMQMDKVTPIDIEKFLMEMRNKKIRNKTSIPEEQRPLLSATTVRYVYTLVSGFFSRAVKWDYLEKSPVKADKPAVSNKQRLFWQPERFGEALAEVDDDILHLAIHLAFRCTMREGEVCALTLDNFNQTSRELAIEKTLQRVTFKALKNISHDRILHVFEPYQANSKSTLILKPPKSEMGVRTNKVSSALSEEIDRRIQKIAQDKIVYGDAYQDNNLLLCYPDGRPIDPRRIHGNFKKWQKNHGIPDSESVDFHSIRISSTSLKLVVSGGDIKSVQKDLGDKTTHMVLNTYARSLNKHHDTMNEKFDTYFYHDGNADAQMPLETSPIGQQLVHLLQEQLSQPAFLQALVGALTTSLDKTP